MNFWWPYHLGVIIHMTFYDVVILWSYKLKITAFFIKHLCFGTSYSKEILYTNLASQCVEHCQYLPQFSYKLCQPLLLGLHWHQTKVTSGKGNSPANFNHSPVSASRKLFNSSKDYNKHFLYFENCEVGRQQYMFQGNRNCVDYPPILGGKPNNLDWTCAWRNLIP